MGYQVANTLFRTQSRLTNLQVHHNVDEAGPVPLPQASNLRDVTRLSLYLETTADSDRRRNVLRAVPSLQSLAIRLGPAYDSRHVDVAEDHVQLLQMLFAKESDDAVKQNLAVRKLRLEDVELTLVGSRLPSMIEFGSLSTLVLDSCADATFLLKALTPLGLGLEWFADLHAEILDYHFNARDDFIQSLRGPRRISMSHAAESYGDNEHMHVDFASIGLGQQAKLLRSLHLDDYRGVQTRGKQHLRPSRGRSCSLNGFSQLCEGCDKLEQLAICAPCLSEDMS